MDIGVLDPTLELLKKDIYIPNSLGTKSYIDLYAKDQWGHHVLIELKRSNAAAREAIHEIHKYVESVKSHFGVNDDEIRVIIASTEWKELLVPFSRLMQDTSMSLQGLQLHIEEETKTISSEIVEALKITSGRFLAPWHEVNLYFDKSSLDRGVKSYENSCKSKRITDYVLVTLESPEYLYELNEGMKCMLYFAMQELSDDICFQILSDLGSSELLEEVNCFLKDSIKDDHLGILHNNVCDLAPVPHRDYFEIGYDAKFNKILEDEGWNILEIFRYGIFSRNQLLEDNKIISELCGHDGRNKVRFQKKISSANKAHIAKIRSDLQACLVDNPIWQAHLTKIIYEIETDFPNSEIEISLLNPCTGIGTILWYSLFEDRELYLPSYKVTVTTHILCRYYFGFLVGEKTNTTLANILNKYYEGRVGSLLQALSTGGYDRRDTDILEDLNLTYRTFQYDINENNIVIPFTLKNERWQRTEPIEDDPDFHYKKYSEENPALIQEIMDKVASCFVMM